MAVVKPFRGLRPTSELAEKVAAPPYDVISSAEARELAKNNPVSFLHVNKPEIDLPPDTGLYDPVVYQRGADNLKTFVRDKVLVLDEKPFFYLYRQVMGDHMQLGLVACASVEEYDRDLIKKHELTRIAKEDDRMNHILHLNAHTGPVFLTYQARPVVSAFLERLVEGKPEFDFTSPDGIQHLFWVVRNDDAIRRIEEDFMDIPKMYVADGHHRSAAASRVCAKMRAANPDHTGREEYNFFLSVIFPHNQMQILDYNRVVTDLNGLSTEAFLEQISRKFLVRIYSDAHGYKPSVLHDFGMYLGGAWYRLSAIPGTWDDSSPTARLDVSILAENLLKPVLGIGDARTDKRIDFIGGIRGLEALKKRVDSGEMAVAFSLFATRIEDLLAIADAGEIMPPKSTWFEPKLKSGLVVHLLD
jgi:uncharacterized protein (DUF1015 family)